MNFTIELEEWHRSPVIRRVSDRYGKLSADLFKDHQARLQPRQAIFLRNLITLALELQSPRIPVDFMLNGQHVYLDRGCIKIAEYSGFIRPLNNNRDGVVDEIVLSFDV